MEKGAIAFFFLAAALFHLGHTQESAGPPPVFVNQFFSRCFDQASNKNLNYASVVDFIILHTSWFENSDVGSCAANNPDVNDEANCWKNAFADLISRRSSALTAARECVDKFVAFTRAHRQKRTTSGYHFFSGYSSRYTRYNPFQRQSLDSLLCPNVNRTKFVERVLEKVEEAGLNLTQADQTLTDLDSVAQFVEQSALCSSPTCDQCTINYVSKGIYPAFELPCSRCWPTRLAGVIKSSSPLKHIITEVAVELGNNRPSKPPPQKLSLFLSSCLKRRTNTDDSWRSLIDFALYHTSWYENSNIGSCSPQTPDLREETRCWLEAYGHLVSRHSPLLGAARSCVRDLASARVQAHGKRIRKTFIHSTQGLVQNDVKRSRYLNSRYCPEVNPQQFANVFMQHVTNSTTEQDFLSRDQTLKDFHFVIQQVTSSLICQRDTCDACSYSYSYSYSHSYYSRYRHSTYPIPCHLCWPTRLAGMIKNSSPLKQPAIKAAQSFAH